MSTGRFLHSPGHECICNSVRRGQYCSLQGGHNCIWNRHGSPFLCSWVLPRQCNLLSKNYVFFRLCSKSCPQEVKLYVNMVYDFGGCTKKHGLHTCLDFGPCLLCLFMMVYVFDSLVFAQPSASSSPNECRPVNTFKPRHILVQSSRVPTIVRSAGLYRRLYLNSNPTFLPGSSL